MSASSERQSALRPAAFLDRDGVLNEERAYVHRIEDFVLLPGAVPGMRRLQQLGYALVVVTNQAGIARGYYSEAQLAQLHQHLQALLADQGLQLSAIYHCPHHPQGAVPALARDCDCRKPAPGMLLRAAAENGLDLARSLLVGDKRSDLDAGRAAGLAACVLVRSGHAFTPADAQAADHVADDLLAAAEWVAIHHPLPGSPA